MSRTIGNVVRARFWRGVPETSAIVPINRDCTMEDLSPEDQHMIQHDLEVLARVVSEKERACVIADGDFIKAELAKNRAHEERLEAIAAFHAERRLRGIPNE